MSEKGEWHLTLGLVTLGATAAYLVTVLVCDVSQAFVAVYAAGVATGVLIGRRM